MGGVRRGKQNNFAISQLKLHYVSWPIFSHTLLGFVLGTNGKVRRKSEGQARDHEYNG